jgi:hypothetical protein
MARTVKGSGNIVAGRDLVLARARPPESEPEAIARVFESIDRVFRNAITETGIVMRGSESIEFSSEALFRSLVLIGIPVAVAIDVPRQIIPLLKSLIENADHPSAPTTNDIKMAVLQLITGLEFSGTAYTNQEVTTWCTAYVRRYGSAAQFMRVLDNGVEMDLNYDYIKGSLLPHVFCSVLGLEKGVDPFEKYKEYFTPPVLQRMATEVLRFVNMLNLYTVSYKTLYHVVKETVLQPPHPWIVSEATVGTVMAYNIERATHHYIAASSEIATQNPALFLPAVRECCIHLCAAILSYYRCLLGAESRYGLLELIRVMNLKLKHRNLLLWSYSKFDSIETDLHRIGLTPNGFLNFLERLNSSLYQVNTVDSFNRAKQNCDLLVKYTNALLGTHVSAACKEK